MKNQISKRTLIELLLNRCGYRRVSFKGLKTDFPQIMGILKRASLDLEDYEAITLQEKQDEKIDSFFLVFININHWPIIIPAQDFYDEEIYLPLFSQLDLGLETEELNIMCGNFK